jgi:hypothetical protein
MVRIPLLGPFHPIAFLKSEVHISSHPPKKIQHPFWVIDCLVHVQ